MILMACLFRFLILLLIGGKWLILV